MKSRREMLRAFVAECYADEPLSDVVDQLADVMPNTSAADRVRAAQVPVLLPDLVVVVEQVVLKAEDDPHVRGFAGGLLTYVYNPLDLIQAEGVAGWLDDAVVCALGLQRLHREKLIVLDEPAQGLCEVASAPQARLEEGLRAVIQDFVDGLWHSSGSLPVMAPA